MTGSRIPAVPLALGLGGLLPFAALALASVTGAGSGLGFAPPRAADALALYGAVIASFLGGIRWGLALREEGRTASRDLVLSVVPSLLAFACALLPPPGRLASLAALIAIWGVVDQDLARRGSAPSWFGRLRAILSAGAAAALAVGAIGG